MHNKTDQSIRQQYFEVRKLDNETLADRLFNLPQTFSVNTELSILLIVAATRLKDAG